MHTLDFPISTLLDDLVARLGPSSQVQEHVIALFATPKGPRCFVKCPKFLFNFFCLAYAYLDFLTTHYLYSF